MFLENKTADFEVDSEHFLLNMKTIQLFHLHYDTVGNHGNGWKGV